MTLLAVRGRGIARLIEGITRGDPVAIGITAVIVLAMIGTAIYKAKRDR